METRYVGTSRPSLIRLARWWLTATKAQRLEALKASIRGEAQAPDLKTLHIAWILAEAEATRERLARGEAPHGAPATDA